MKSIKFILMSYFQQQFFGILGMFLAFGLFIVANFSTFSIQEVNLNGDFRGWKIFFIALVVLIMVMAMHLRRMLKSNATALLPHYRSKQLLAAGSLIFLFIFWPALLTWYLGFPILLTLGMFLFATGIILWICFKYSDNLIPLLLIIWCLRIFYELTGIPVKYPVFNLSSDSWIILNQQHLMLFLIVFSLFLIYRFVIYYLRIPKVDFEDETNDVTETWTREFDKAGRYSQKIITKMINKMLKKSVKVEMSVFNLANQFKYGIFSPNMISNISALNFPLILLYFFSITFLFGSEPLFAINSALPFLLFIFLISAAQLTTDFLHHRTQLSILWLQDRSSTRKQFVHALMIGYLSVCFKQHLVISVFYFVLGLFFLDMRVYSILQIILIGATIYPILAGLSLIFSKLIKSPDAKGWIISNIIVATIFLILMHKALPGNFLTFFSIMIVFAILVLIISMRKFTNCELDFVGPELTL